MSKKFATEVDTACKTIANAAELALNKIANVEERLKVMLADDAIKALKVEEKRADSSGFMDFIYKQGTLGVAIIGVAFGVYFTFANPTQDNNTALQLQDQRITGQQKTIDGLNLTSQNDIKELKSEISGLRIEVQTATNQIIKLQTILEERLPVKK